MILENFHAKEKDKPVEFRDFIESIVKCAEVENI